VSDPVTTHPTTPWLPSDLHARGWDHLSAGAAALAEEVFRDWSRIDPWCSEPWRGLAAALGELGLHREARAARAECASCRALCWDGGDLHGGALLVGRPGITVGPDGATWGLGDYIEQARWLGAVVGRARGPVVLWLPLPLHGLLSSIPGITLADSALPAPPHARRISLIGLPWPLAGPVEWACPYLRPELARVEHWRRELARQPGEVLVAIHWEGSLGPGGFRSIPLSAFAPLAGVKGVRLISVQAGPGREQLAGCGFPVTDAAGDLEDLAAVLRHVDLFIGCDSAPIHLAGALRVPAVLLLSNLADPRWTEGNPPANRTNLYPSLAVAQLGVDADDWEDLLEQAAAQLGQWLRERE
jgi:hypothetical protein